MYAAAFKTINSNQHQAAPLSSSPLLPARPLIWMYSPLRSHLKVPPSHFRARVKATDFAGMLRPVENVSVANSTLSRPSCRTYGTQWRVQDNQSLWWPYSCFLLFAQTQQAVMYVHHKKAG
jgi:hypothetical protein